MGGKGKVGDIDLPNRMGKVQWLKHVCNTPQTLEEAVKAKCYECTGFYSGGAKSCGVKVCPLFPYHYYNPKNVKMRRDRNKRKG